MANRKVLVSGSIMEIPLEKDYGFGYVKLIFTKDIDSEPDENLIVKAYNVYSQIPLKDFDPKNFETDNLILFPMLSLGYPPLRGKHKWSLIGTADLTEEDKIIPDYVMTKHFDGSDDLKQICQETNNGCGVIRGLYPNLPIYTNDYEAIKHLGKWQLKSPHAIKVTMTMEWMKRRGDNILDFYKDHDFKEDFWDEITYKAVMNNKVDFSQIRIENRMKANI